MKIIFIGKSSTCDIILDSKTVSEEHAQLIIKDKYIEVIDLGSTNGTFVNGDRIKGVHQLKKDDFLVVGAVGIEWEEYLALEKKEIDKSTSFIPAKKRNLNLLVFLTLTLGLIIGIVYFITSYEKDATKDNSESNITVTHALPVVEPGEVDYDFSCLEEEGDHDANEIITTLSDWEQELFDAFGEEVTIEEEMDCGKQMSGDIITSDSGSNYTLIQTILKKLVTAIPNKKGYTYEIHLVKEDVINAFTCGGQIFVFQGIIDFCRNKDELAAIIAHEIAHNELGHIKHKLSQIKTSNEWFGDGWGDLTANIYMSATVSFGQKQETHCDLYGIDLAIKAGFNACKTDQIWKRMNDNEYSVGESILRSHPYSSQRASCCRNHITTHHTNDCK